MRRIIKREDGGVSVVVPAPKSRRVIFTPVVIDGVLTQINTVSIDMLPLKLSFLDANGVAYQLEPEEHWLERVFTKAMQPQYDKEGTQVNCCFGCEYEDVPVSEVPSDRTFRDAWELNGKGIEVNIGKAKAIQLDRWRTARKPLLEAFDVEFIKALEAEDKIQITEIKAKKQALRDVTKMDLSSITTPEQLKNVWPEILK